MKFYFFKPPPASLAARFNRESVLQNLASVRIFSWGMLSLSSLLLISNYFLAFDYLLTRPVAYNRLTWFFLLTSIGGLAAAFFFQRKQEIRYTQAAKMFNLVFAFLFMAGCMALSFIPQNNPKNNMTMYLLGAVGLAVAWSLTIREALLLMVGTSIIFSVGIQYAMLSEEQLLLNSLGSVIILISFYKLSRMIYSYRVNHYMQLRNIEAQKQEIQKISAAKSEILGIVAHDLQSPISNIELLVSQLRNKKLTPQQEQQYLQLVQTCCLKSRGIISDLLELARIEQEQEFRVEKTNLNVFLQEMQAQWQQQMKDNRKLDIKVAPVPLYAALHKEKFQRVLDNLLSNAIKFTPPGGRISISVSRQDQEALLCITDNGIGVPQKLKPHLFQPFSKAGRKGLNGEASTGLGLNISRKLVEQHKGTITLESEENEGTSFLIKLPLLSAAPVTIPTAAAG